MMTVIKLVKEAEVMVGAENILVVVLVFEEVETAMMKGAEVGLGELESVQ